MFNHKVHERDPKTGLVTKTNNYQMRVSKEHGTTYIRGGKEYNPDGTIKRDLNPQVSVEAKVEAPAPIAEPEAPKVEDLSPEEIALGIQSSSEMAKKATKGEIRRAK